MAEKFKAGSLVAQVTKEIGSKSAKAYLGALGKSVTSNKLKAMVAAAIHCGAEITDPKVKAILGTLEAFDIRSERHAQNYIKGGMVAIKAQMTEAEIAKIGIARIMKFANQLLKSEQTGSTKIVQTAIKDYEATLEKKKSEKAAKADEEKAARKQATQTNEELLNEAFEEEDGLQDTRVYAHVSVFFADIEEKVVRVLGTNASTAMKNLRRLIENEYNRLEKADKEAAEKKAKASSK